MFEGAMSVSLRMVKCYSPPVLLGTANKSRTRYKARLNQSVVARISSVLLQTDDSGNPLEPTRLSGPREAITKCQTQNSLLRQANTVGIIGGVSVLTTLIFLEKLVWWSSRNGEECVPFVICSDPSFSQELPYQASFNSCQTRIAHMEFNHDTIEKNLRNKTVFLEQSGACCIVIPCHLLQAWQDEISGVCSLPFLNFAQCVALELKEAKLKPIGTESNVRIGLLAKQETLTAGVYQEKLQEQGFNVVLPDKATMEHILIPAIEAFHRGDIEGARNLLRITIHVLLIRAVNIVILALDEMQGLLPCNDPLLHKCIDPMDALARSTIAWAKTAAKIR